MYYSYGYPYQYSAYQNMPINPYGGTPAYMPYPTGVNPTNPYNWHGDSTSNQGMVLKDYGKNPFVTNIEEATKRNNTYRTALWTGDHLQLTLMSINPGEDIGLEVHPHVDQFIRIEQGQGIVQMGKSKDHLNFRQMVFEDFAIFVPAGTWHNVTNTGNSPIKLYTIYAPPNHPFGTVQPTKASVKFVEPRS
ncbi:MAG: cupin domain-containing protein [Solibacillus sp.]|uniref:cupin domain-containing protein n=1 Tax=Solibacillus sp. TaxID=1909654 RepID=UPI0033155B26